MMFWRRGEHLRGANQAIMALFEMEGGDVQPHCTQATSVGHGSSMYCVGNSKVLAGNVEANSNAKKRDNK